MHLAESPSSNEFIPRSCTSRRKRIVSRAVLIFGFSSLLVLMAILAVDSIRALHELEASTSRVRHDYLTCELTLHKIRLGIYESGSLLREYAVANSDPGARESYAAQLNDMRDQAN